MYGQQSNMKANEFPIFYSPSSPSPSPSSTEIFQGHLPSSSLPAPLAIPVNEYEYLSVLKSELNHSSSSGCSCYNSPTSLTSFGTSNSSPAAYYGSPPASLTSFELANNPIHLMMQRSISSHSLLHNKNLQAFSRLGYLDSETSPVRKVSSTGDLLCMNPKPNNHRLDNSLADEYSIIASMSKASKYSPEEKKERIERYRSKRNLRNFNKKIKYECRKTLADSRPRIRGRFARNDEIDQKACQNQWDHAGIDQEEDEDDENWISILDALSANLIP